MSDFDVRRVLNGDALRLLEGEDPSAATFIPGQILEGLDFTISLRFDRLANGTLFTAKLSGLECACVLAAGDLFDPSLDPEQWGPPVTTLALMFRRGDDLFQLMRDSQDRPLKPVVELVVSPRELLPNQTVTAQATLKDINDSVVPGETMELEWNAPSGSGRDRFSGVTDANGVFSRQVPATFGGATGTGKFTARFIRDGVPHEGSAQVRFYRVVEPSGDLRLTSPNPSVRVGDPEQLCALLQQSGSPVAGAVVNLGATRRGTLDAASVVTGADGQGCTTFRAGDTTGIATISGENQPSGQLTSRGVRVLQVPLTASLELMVDGGVSFGLTAESTEVSAGGFTSVTADLLVGGARLANIPISFRLSGPGSLVPATVQTDQNGSAAAIYQAPIESGSATITAEVVVNGQSFTRNVTINITSAASITVMVLSFDCCRTTGVEATDTDPVSEECVARQLTTLGGTAQTCERGGFFQVPGTPTAPPAAPPLTLAASVSGSQIQATLRQPAGNAVAFDVTANASASSISFWQAFFVVQLSFTQPGVLNVQIEPGWFDIQTSAAVVAGVEGEFHIVASGPNCFPGTDCFAGSVAITGPSSITLHIHVEGTADTGSNSVEGRVITMTFTPSP